MGLALKYITIANSDAIIIPIRNYLILLLMHFDKVYLCKLFRHFSPGKPYILGSEK